MALTPISMFQPQGSGIAQFLQGGQNALAAALNNVVQVGRDTANKQFAQERDFLGEQKRVEDLAQRRGEVAQQQGNFERTFARNLFVSDRDFQDRNDDQARAEKRMRAQDLFNRTESNRNYDLRKSEADLRMDVFEEQQRTRDEQEQFEKDILAQDGVLPQKPSLTAEFLYGPVGKKGVDVTVAASTPEERLAEATIRMEAAKGKDAKIFTEAAREKAKAEAEIKASGSDVSAAERRAQSRYENYAADRATAEVEKAEKKTKEEADIRRSQANGKIAAMVRTDFKAFPLAQSYLPPEGSNPPEGMTADELKMAREEAKLTDADREMVERNAATNSPEVMNYVVKAFRDRKDLEGWDSLTDEQKEKKAIQVLGKAVVEKRKALWNEAKVFREGETASSPVAEEIKRQKEKQSQIKR